MDKVTEIFRQVGPDSFELIRHHNDPAATRHAKIDEHGTIFAIANGSAETVAQLNAQEEMVRLGHRWVPVAEDAPLRVGDIVSL